MKKATPSVRQVMKTKHPVCLSLIKRVEIHSELLVLIKQSLPEVLAENCNGCCLNRSTLILYSRSATWISQLRFYQPTILETLKLKTPQYAISEILFRVQVTSVGLATQQTKRQPHVPSSQTIDEIAKSARYVTDTQLRSSLESLVKTLRDKAK